VTTRLLLVRHGESTWNAARRWQGRADPPLSPRGEQQATDAARALAGLAAIDAVATSSLRRARRTGELIAGGLGVGVLAAEPGLDERSAGAWEGLTRDEINHRYPGFLDGGHRPEGYESDDSLLSRVLPALRATVERGERSGHRRVVVVSHGGVLGALERHAHETATGEPSPWVRFANLEGRWFTFDGAAVRLAGDRVRLVDEPELATDAPTPGYA
jgi:broad specificity phosphatase PhoE